MQTIIEKFLTNIFFLIDSGEGDGAGRMNTTPDTPGRFTFQYPAGSGGRRGREFAVLLRPSRPSPVHRRADLHRLRPGAPRRVPYD